jgi:hypothetical protein
MTKTMSSPSATPGLRLELLKTFLVEAGHPDLAASVHSTRTRSYDPIVQRAKRAVHDRLFYLANRERICARERERWSRRSRP